MTRQKRIVRWRQYTREEKRQVWFIHDITCKQHRIIEKYISEQDPIKKQEILKKYLEVDQVRKYEIEKIQKYKPLGTKIPEFEEAIKHELEQIKTTA